MVTGNVGCYWKVVIQFCKLYKDFILYNLMRFVFILLFFLPYVECILKYTIIREKKPYIPNNETNVKYIPFENFTDDDMQRILLLF